MTEKDFAYWLQGYFEISGAKKLTGDQIKIIRNHINLVKKCWEPKKEKPAAGFVNVHDDNPPPGSDTHTPSGEILFRC